MVDGKSTSQVVQLGIKGDLYTEITGGLKEGDKVELGATSTSSSEGGFRRMSVSGAGGAGPTVMRPHLGQGGCQGLEDAAILARLVGIGADVRAAFARFAELRQRRVRPIVRESRRIGQVLNLRPEWLGSAAAHASALVPERALMRHLSSLASRGAFVLPE